MNEYEEKLRKVLQEYIEDGSFMNYDGNVFEDKEVRENTSKIDYIYKVYPLYGGNLNENMVYEWIHTLIPDLPEAIEVFEGILPRTSEEIMMSYSEKSSGLMWFASKEIIEDQDEQRERLNR